MIFFLLIASGAISIPLKPMGKKKKNQKAIYLWECQASSMGKGLRHWDFFNSLPFCTSMSSFMSELNNKGWKGPLCEVWHAQNLPKRKKSATATYWYHLGPNVSFLRNGKPRKMMSHHGCPSPQSCDLWISLWKAFSWWKQLPLPPPLRTTPIPPSKKYH